MPSRTRRILEFVSKEKLRKKSFIYCPLNDAQLGSDAQKFIKSYSYAPPHLIRSHAIKTFGV